MSWLSDWINGSSKVVERNEMPKKIHNMLSVYKYFLDFDDDKKKIDEEPDVYETEKAIMTTSYKPDLIVIRVELKNTDIFAEIEFDEETFNPKIVNSNSIPHYDNFEDNYDLAIKYILRFIKNYEPDYQIAKWDKLAKEILDRPYKSNDKEYNRKNNDEFRLYAIRNGFLKNKIYSWDG